MKAFCDLCRVLARAGGEGDIVAALSPYLAAASPPDRVWAVALLTGRRPRAALPAAEFRAAVIAAAGLPDWLFAECLTVAGDLAETAALILPAPGPGLDDPGLTLSGLMASLRQGSRLPPARRGMALITGLLPMPPADRIVPARLMLGQFRPPLPRDSAVALLARALGQDLGDFAARIDGDWSPEAMTWAGLMAPPGRPGPYPFCPGDRAAPILRAPADLERLTDWLIEWHWPGPPAQIVVSRGAMTVWGPGGMVLTRRYPSLAPLADFLPDVVLSGAVLTPAKAPATFVAQDLLAEAGVDLRDRPLSVRRERLARLVAALPPRMPATLSPALSGDGVADLRATARDRGAIGLTFRRWDAPHDAGRAAQTHRLWPAPPLQVTCVLMQAEIAAAGGAPVLTLGLRDGANLIPVARLIPDLPVAELTEIADWVRAHTIARFGPVRTLPAIRIFDLAFDDAMPNARKKSGLILRGARVPGSWRDGEIDATSTIDDLRRLAFPAAPAWPI